MPGGNKKVQSDKKAKDFIDKYNDLCKEVGFRIVVTHAFKSNGDGSFSVVLQSFVWELPKKK